MPSLAASVPQYPRRFDLLDATGPAERQLQSAEASVWIVVGALNSLPPVESAKAANLVRALLTATQAAVNVMVVNKATSVPSFITTGGGLTAYRAASGVGSAADAKVAVDAAVVKLGDIFTLV